MQYRTPEQMGISSKHVLAFYKELDFWHLSTHAVILSRGEDFFSECYYTPFHKDFKHRMYSTTKSFVSLAIGFCEQDGLLSLDDPLSKFFPEYKDCEYFYTTSIRDMLQMRNAKDASGGTGWFGARTDDRVRYYFSRPPLKNAGSLFHYDSNGSFMLCAVVEKLTGKPFIEYLKDKALRDIGFSEDAYCLKCPGGHSWGDSGLLCTARDLWLFARFIMKKGEWNGKQYIDRSFMEEAISLQSFNHFDTSIRGWGKSGYGYLIKIDHNSNGFVTYYAHCSALYVSVGDKVYKGEHIAAMGSTGISTGSHLHFGILKNGTWVNPMNYLP
jgi:CubicO group peptidase (beta-lactamase class C family)